LRKGLSIVLNARDPVSDRPVLFWFRDDLRLADNPALAAAHAKWVHRPWDAPKDVLAKAGVSIGGTYPQPIIDHAFARKRALEIYGEAKSSREETSA
jgi:deoxyribodipyrimidine photolyase